MVTDYEKYLVLSGMNIREQDQRKEDLIADEMDKLWSRISEYQRNCARAAGEYALKIEDRIDREGA